MQYFTPQFLTFFEHLAGNNSKERFDGNTNDYHTYIKDPFDIYLTDVIASAFLTDNRITIEPKHAKFRINRDIRFSKNKEPYKTNISAIISPQGRKNRSFPWLYIQLWQDGLHFWTWAYNSNTQELHNIRTYIATHPQKFLETIYNKEFVEIFWTLQGEENKRIKKDYFALAEQSVIDQWLEIDVLIQIQLLLMRKQFYVYTKFDHTCITSEGLLELTMIHRNASQNFRYIMEEALF